jgi:hypothetical protein
MSSSLGATSGDTHFDDAFAREVVEKLAPNGVMGLLDKLDSVAKEPKSL